MNLHQFFEGALEITLQEIKHSLLRWVSLHVKSHRIGISEGSPRPYNQFRYVFQELKIPHSVVRLKVGQKLIHLILNLDFLLLSEPDCFIVLGVPGPEVAQLADNLLQFLLLLLLASVGTLRRHHVLVGVAQVAARLSRVVAVVAHAEPAELVLALGTGHVHAALVFLDAYFALGTGFGVQFQPDLRVVHALVDLRLPFRQ